MVLDRNGCVMRNAPGFLGKIMATEMRFDKVTGQTHIVTTVETKGRVTVTRTYHNGHLIICNQEIDGN